jgi:hypothetical protein
MSKNRDLVIVFFWAIMLLLVTLTMSVTMLSTLIAVPLLLLLSGYSVLRAIGIAAAPLEYAVYAVGTSIASCVVGGLVLNLLSLLTPFGWAVWLVVLTGTMWFLVARRHDGATIVIGPLVRLPRMKRWHRVILGLATAITVSAYVLALHDEANDREFVYTDFWMVPKGASGVLALGIKSAETAPQIFEVEVLADGHMIANFHSIDLGPGETWTHNIALTPKTKRVDAKLYNTEHAVYRKVSYQPPPKPGE